MNVDQKPIGSPPWQPRTPPVTANSFSKIVEAEPSLAVHFWAEWNSSTDSKMDDAIQAIAPRLKNWVSFYSANFDLPENRELIERLDFHSVPCVIIFINGRTTRHIIGLMDEKSLALEVLLGLTNRPSNRHWWKFW